MSPDPTDRRHGRHDADIVSLVFGALFVAAAAFYGLVEQGDDGGNDWYLPVVLIVVGVLGLLASVPGRRS